MRRRYKPEASEALEANGSELDIGEKGISFPHVLFNPGRAKHEKIQHWRWKALPRKEVLDQGRRPVCCGHFVGIYWMSIQHKRKMQMQWAGRCQNSQSNPTILSPPCPWKNRQQGWVAGRLLWWALLQEFPVWGTVWGS